MRNWPALNRPDIDYLYPFLTPYFDETKETLQILVEERMPEPVYLMGSSPVEKYAES